MHDIVFCTLPPMPLQLIYSGPPALKGAVESAGYKAKCFDFAMDLFKFCNKNFEQYAKFQQYFLIKTGLSEQEKLLLEQYYDHIVDTVISANTRYIGFTVFSYYTHNIVIDILTKLKQKGLTDKVILGGRGLTTESAWACFDTAGSPESKLYFYELLESRQLAKHFILGDGLSAVIDFLDGKDIPRSIISGNDVTTNFYSNYDDYNFEDYDWVNRVPALQITGSTGCVRNCDFCDVPIQFKKYKFKDGLDFANEMIHLQQRHNINKFVLTDSLSNGSMKHFKKMLERLAEHNQTTATPIVWTGQYICRDVDEHSTRDMDAYYKLLKLSGAEGLTIGAESGSNRVLAAINKKSTVEALFFELDYFRKHGITCSLLTFVGHWSETHEDFVDHARMMIKLAPYSRSNTVSSIVLGKIYKLIPGTPSASNINNIVDQQNFLDLWVNRHNRSNTLKTRLSRRLTISLLAEMLKLPVVQDAADLLEEIEHAKQKKTEINSFFTKHSANTDSAYIKDMYEFVNKIFAEKTTLDIKIKLRAQSCNSAPTFVVKCDNSVMLEKTLQDGAHEFSFSLPADNNAASMKKLSLSMTNKGQFDTKIDRDGNIVKDKSIVFESILIDNFDLLNDYEFFNSKMYVEKNNARHPPTAPGLWSNDPLCLEFSTPFALFYVDRLHIASQKFVSSVDQYSIAGDLESLRNESKTYIDQHLVI